ncbi:unnamed protein product, partial [Didymodactylos carnosus]
TLFDVREGRCSRGIYGSLVKANSPDFDYILLIDSEGLLSIERGDREYDRLLILFCLAISHVVIINMTGDMNEALKGMLTLCAESLKQLGVAHVPQPIVHFVLNQRADLNLQHHETAIRRICTDMKNLELSTIIDIREETFHTLPSAFKKECPLSDMLSSVYVNRTEPDFIKRVQQLCVHVIESAQQCFKRTKENEQFTDPAQWIRFTTTIFDIIQKFPDLTYFKDINERRQDNEIREHIKKQMAQIFTAEYRQELVSDSSNKTERQIEETFQVIFDKHYNDLYEKLENVLKIVKASDTIRERTRQFFKTQIIETKNAWQTACIMVTDKKKMEALVRDGAEDLRHLIDQTINDEQQNNVRTTKENADA